MNNKRQKRHTVLYTTSFTYMRGGGQWSLYYLIKHLNKDIFYPIVMCPDEGELAEKMRVIGAEVICFDVGRIRYLNPFVIKRLIAIIKEKHIALIHTDSTTETFYAGIAARMMRVPLLWHIRVSEQEWFIDRVLAMLSTKLIIVANAISRRFAWLQDTQKLVVVYNGIDLEEFDHFQANSSIRREYRIAKDIVLLGCIGRIEQRKGQESLIAAMRHIDNTKLIFVGRGDEKYIGRMKSLCSKFGILNRVVFAGPRDDIPTVLKEIDILVFPSIKGEGFPRVILEAMAAGKPIVATDNAGNPEAVEDGLTGYIVPIKHIPVLASKITELVADKIKRRAMGQAGRKRLEELFTIQQHMKRIHNLYLEVLQKEHKPK